MSGPPVDAGGPLNTVAQPPSVQATGPPKENGDGSSVDLATLSADRLDGSGGQRGPGQRRRGSGPGIMEVLDRTLSSDARTERLLRLLGLVLFAGVLTVLGIVIIVIIVVNEGAWWSLIPGLGLTIAGAGTAIVRRRWRKRDSTPASVRVPTPRKAEPTRQRGYKQLRKQPPGNRAGAGGKGSRPARRAGG
jgi:hypothetical protein